MNLKCALIGGKLGHSYSKKIHEYLSDYSYDLVELEPSQEENFIKSLRYDAFNVTIPYKQSVMKYLDVIDTSAQEIGAVNTVVRRDGILYGYNTDFFGMKYALERAGIEIKAKKVMILGSGGTSKTARAVCSSLGAKEIVIVSRSGQINYSNCYQIKDAQVIINTTPVGTYPNTDHTPIDLDKFNNLTGVFDAVYNPSCTRLLFDAKRKGLKNSNGLPMLVAQAKRASELFTNSQIPDTVIEEIIKDFTKQNLNLVLIGMSGSGKSTIARELANRLGRQFIDTDLEIEKDNGAIPDIFKNKGEEHFRDLESQVALNVGKLTGKVIATGGGIVKREQNYFYLSQNGIIVFIDRDIQKLASENRPLSKDFNAIKNLYAERIDSYLEFSDVKVENNDSVDKTIEEIIEKL